MQATGAGNNSTKTNPLNGGPDGNNPDDFRVGVAGVAGAYTAAEVADVLYYIRANG